MRIARVFPRRTRATPTDRLAYTGPRYDVPAGDPGRPCKGCGHNIHFVRTKTGAWMPINWDGVPHFVTCPDRAQFTKPPLRKMDVEDA